MYIYTICQRLTSFLTLIDSLTCCKEANYIIFNKRCFKLGFFILSASYVVGTRWNYLISIGYRSYITIISIGYRSYITSISIGYRSYITSISIC